MVATYMADAGTFSRSRGEHGKPASGEYDLFTTPQLRTALLGVLTRRHAPTVLDLTEAIFGSAAMAVWPKPATLLGA